MKKQPWILIKIFNILKFSQIIYHFVIESKMLKLKLNQKGFASIPTVIVILILIVSIGVLISSISVADNLTVSGLLDSNKALNFAQSGAKDALEKIARNKDYNGSYNMEMVAGGCSGAYAGCAAVNVNSDSSPKIVTVEGRVGSMKRKIQVNAVLDSSGLITSYSWQEL